MTSFSPFRYVLARFLGLRKPLSFPEYDINTSLDSVVKRIIFIIECAKESYEEAGYKILINGEIRESRRVSSIG